MARFKRFSRYTNGIVTKNREDEDFLILRRPLKLREGSGDVFITITKDIKDRPDLIGDKAYGETKLWWAIYEFNGIRDPLFNLEEGQVLRIPEKERLLEAINRFNSR